MKKLSFKNIAKKISAFLLSLSGVFFFHLSLASITKSYIQVEPLEEYIIYGIIICSLLMIFFVTLSFMILRDWRVFSSLMIIYGLSILLIPDSLPWVSVPFFGTVFIILGNTFMISQNTIHLLKNRDYLRSLFNWKGLLFDLLLIIGLTFLGQTVITFIFSQHDNQILILAISNIILMTAGFALIARRTEYTSFIYLLITAIGLFIISIPYMGLVGLATPGLLFIKLMYILAATGLGWALRRGKGTSYNAPVNEKLNQNNEKGDNPIISCQD
jgi:hypothetical protein